MRLKGISTSVPNSPLSGQGSSVSSGKQVNQSAGALSVNQAIAGSISTVPQQTEAAIASVRNVATRTEVAKVKSFDEAAAIARDVADRIREKEDGSGEVSDHHKLSGLEARKTLV